MSDHTHKVTYSDGSETVVEWSVEPIMAIHAEREFGKPITPLLVEDYLEPYFFCVWWKLKQTGRTPFAYEPWLALVSRMDRVDTSEGEPKPADADPKLSPPDGDDPESS